LIQATTKFKKYFLKKQKYTTNQKHLQEYTLAAHGLGSRHLAAHSSGSKELCKKQKLQL
jgi:hypothetical protein